MLRRAGDCGLFAQGGSIILCVLTDLLRLLHLSADPSSKFVSDPKIAEPVSNNEFPLQTLDFSDLGPLLRGSIFRQAIATCSGLVSSKRAFAGGESKAQIRSRLQRKVNLRNCTAIVDEDIASLVSSTANSRGTLESLDLIGATLLTDKALEFVSQITTLRHLSLERNCLVTDPGLACLASLRCLKFFRCASMPGVSAEGVTTFFSTRSTNGSVPIQRVDLSKTAVNDAALTLIAEQGGHHLECLNLSRAGPCSDLTQPTDASFLILATSCRSIKHLDISYCTQVTGKTVSAICEGFADLLSVNLTGCRGVPVSCLGLMGELRRKYGRLW